MNYAQGTRQLDGLRKEIAAIRKKMRKVQASLEPEEVEDYALEGPDGRVRLSQLFGDKDELFVVHNMGRSCVYCTLWADGVNGVYDHLADHAAFVVTSPDTPAAQRKFAAGRGWRFPMLSHRGTSFAADMGYGSAEKGWRPGISVFARRGETLLRVSDTGFGPGDDFSAVWHLFDLLPEGAGDWSPQYRYRARKAAASCCA
jgi:predicted dithiol-disulfide oxidoreductase (DUF899 family)